ncbi:MAG: NAD-dependent malic enzyme [Cyanobacteriota/Melainabacteria group bacterium]
MPDSASSFNALNYVLTIRLRVQKPSNSLSRALNSISKGGGDVGAIDVVKVGSDHVVRDITVSLRDATHADDIVARLKRVKQVEVVSTTNPILSKHENGKIAVVPKSEVTNNAELAQVYTPGVAQVCSEIHARPQMAFTHTIKGNTVAVISDGSRVLSLGNIGARAAMPVMEGKAMLFKQFAGVDAFPICLDTQDTDEIVRTIINISPAFGAINLEDIASPRCYEIETRLQNALDIPVFHDDQHATAIAVLAAAINACKLVGKPLSTIKLVASGVGAAGLACLKLLMAAGVKNVIGFNLGGAVHRQREDLTEQERWLADRTNEEIFAGTMKEALEGADMFLGLSVGNILKGSDLKAMAKDPIIFALANPVPEVSPEKAAKYARVIATGGSNYPNQINNALVFPGIFRGALKARVPQITEEMKMAAAYALAGVIADQEIHEDYVIPTVFDERVATSIAEAVIKVAAATGAARSECN